MSDEEQKQLSIAVSDDLQKIRQEVGELKRTLSARELMEPILPFISVSALAKEYFGKSASWFYQRLNGTSWFYQRLNGNMVHGKPVSFTQEELTVLAHALNDMASKLQQAALTVV